ncbi:MAG: carboxymuconolactone decarboxylase family protein [Spirochaetales bacterium]|nr:carboxymuconolactone decarboxylase family protein [Spirochaetales bacterium]
MTPVMMKDKTMTGLFMLQNGMGKINFKKRYFKTPYEFFKIIKNNFIYAKKIKNIDKKIITPDFAERIMLAVTGVNDCVYCSYRHTKTALEKGVKLKEIQDLLKSEFGDSPEEQQVALLYAQHWTEYAGTPDKNMRKKMIEYYGIQKTKYIEFYMHIVYMGNIISNTVEAYKRKVVPDSGRINFFLVYLLCAPIAFFIKSGTKDVKIVTSKSDSHHR